MSFIKKYKTHILVGAVCLLGFGYFKAMQAKAALEYEKEQAVGEVVVQKARMKSLASRFEKLKATADSLGGELLAAVNLSVPPETLYIPLSEAGTEVRPDSSRYAVREDTLEGGYVIRQEALAPPFPAALSLGATLTTPEFNPSVGFIRSKDGRTYHVAVDWAGKNVTIQDAFHLPQEKRFPRKSVDIVANVMVTEEDPYKLEKSLGIGYSYHKSETVVLTGTVMPIGYKQAGLQLRWSIK